MGESDSLHIILKKFPLLILNPLSDVRVIILCYTSIHLQTITVQGVRWFWPFLDCVNVLR